jgi:hypothetical protein
MRYRDYRILALWLLSYLYSTPKGHQETISQESKVLSPPTHNYRESSAIKNEDRQKKSSRPKAQRVEPVSFFTVLPFSIVPPEHPVMHPEPEHFDEQQKEEK